MMTEDDTFIALRRIPYQQMWIIWKDSGLHWHDPEAEDFLKKYHWTRSELIIEWARGSGR